MDDQIIKKLMEVSSSEDNEKLIATLDEAINLVGEIARFSVKLLQVSSIQLFVGERLVKLGSVIIEPLEEFLQRSEKNDEKVIASLVLLHFGIKTGVPYLINSLNEDEEYLCLIVQKLAEAKVTDVADKIIELLHKIDTGKVDTIVALLRSLEILKIDIPVDIKERFSTPSISWQIQTMIKRINEK